MAALLVAGPAMRVWPLQVLARCYPSWAALQRLPE
jgi:hypothetical protein